MARYEVHHDSPLCRADGAAAAEELGEDGQGRCFARDNRRLRWGFAAGPAVALCAVRLSLALLHCRAAAGDRGVAHKCYQSELAPDAAGAQAVVAWCLRQSFPDVPLQMVAEEDSADLRHACRLCGTACGTEVAACSCCCCACTRHRPRPGCLWRRLLRHGNHAEVD